MAEGKRFDGGKFFRQHLSSDSRESLVHEGKRLKKERKVKYRITKRKYPYEKRYTLWVY